MGSKHGRSTVTFGPFGLSRFSSRPSAVKKEEKKGFDRRPSVVWGGGVSIRQMLHKKSEKIKASQSPIADPQTHNRDE